MEARREALLWLEQARRDLEVARHLSSHRDWYASVFWCHEVAEKALEALLIAAGKPARTHNLLELFRLAGSELGIVPPREVERCAKFLNPHYVVARYPDAANGLPHEIYEEDDARRALECAEAILAWVEQHLH